MSYAMILTPVAMILEVVIFGMGLYAGYCRKVKAGYLFALTFLIFAIFDFFGTLGFSTDFLAAINILAVLLASGGMYLLLDTPSGLKDPEP